MKLSKNTLKKNIRNPGGVFLGVVHRIDRPVSGVVLFARTSKALTRLNELFREKKVKKTYWAVVKNKPPCGFGNTYSFPEKGSGKK